MILDDYHAVTEPQIHRWLSFLIENQPEPLHLVFGKDGHSFYAEQAWSVIQDDINILEGLGVHLLSIEDISDESDIR